MIVYTTTKIFGVDHVKTRVFKDHDAAVADIKEAIFTFSEDGDSYEVIENPETAETYYIVHRSEDPTEFIEFVLRRCEVK